MSYTIIDERILKRRIVLIRISSDSIYEIKPDLLVNDKGIFLAFSESLDHETTSVTKLKMYSISNDLNSCQSIGGENEKRGVPYWSKPFFMRNDANRVIVFTSLIESNKKSGEIYWLEYVDNEWTSPVGTGVKGHISGSPIVLPNNHVLLPVYVKDEATGYRHVKIYESIDMRFWYLNTTLSLEGKSFSHVTFTFEEDIILWLQEEHEHSWDIYFSFYTPFNKGWTDLSKIAVRDVEVPLFKLAQRKLIGFFAFDPNRMQHLEQPCLVFDYTGFLLNPRKFNIQKKKLSCLITRDYVKSIDSFDLNDEDVFLCYVTSKKNYSKKIFIESVPIEKVTKDVETIKNLIRSI